MTRMVGTRALFVVVLGLAACSTTASSLRSRFARERTCPESQVDVDEQGGNQYVARGCGDRAVYVCGAVAGFGDPEKSCNEQGLNRRGPPDTGVQKPVSPDPRIQESPR
jgi:hypothetical protein